MIIKKHKKMKIYKRANWERKTIPHAPQEENKEYAIYPNRRD